MNSYEKNQAQHAVIIYSSNRLQLKDDAHTFFTPILACLDTNYSHSVLLDILVNFIYTHYTYFSYGNYYGNASVILLQFHHYFFV